MSQFRLDRDIIVFDVETSDNVCRRANLISLGAYLFDRSGKATNKCFEVIIKPYKNNWNPEMEQFHGLTLDYVKKNGMPLKKAMKHFLGWCKGASTNFYLGQWGSGFDQPMLELALDYCHIKYPFHHRTYDVSSIARIYLACRGIKTPSLYLCAKNLGVNLENIKEHNAKDDAYMTVQCLEKVVNELCKKAND